MGELALKVQQAQLSSAADSACKARVMLAVKMNHCFLLSHVSITHPAGGNAWLLLASKYRGHA